MENKIQYRLIKKFGPSIFHVKIPDEIINNLNSYVDKIIKNKESYSSGKRSYVSFVKKIELIVNCFFRIKIF